VQSKATKLITICNRKNITLTAEYEYISIQLNGKGKGKGRTLDIAP